MTVPDFIDTFVEFCYLLANVVVCALAAMAYQGTRKRCLLLIALSAGIGAVLSIAPRLRADTPSWTFWVCYTTGSICDILLWVSGAYLLFRDYAGLLAHPAQPGAAPNVGPAASLGNSGVTEGPPSVS